MGRAHWRVREFAAARTGQWARPTVNATRQTPEVSGYAKHGRSPNELAQNDYLISFLTEGNEGDEETTDLPLRFLLFNSPV